MKQLLQSLDSGTVVLAAVPCPVVRENHVLVRTLCSLISSGTERMLLDFGRANLLQKASQQPDKVRMVIEKIRTDGVAATFESVRAKLDSPVMLGYCNAGAVLEAAGDGMEFASGDRVLSNGP